MNNPACSPDDVMAFDRASVRTYDQDGRLRLEITPISKANVCKYVGKEIPKWQSLGLDPNKLYALLRDPDELAKGAATFNNIQLLNKHIPVTAVAPQKEFVVGATGTEAAFDGTYLNNSLVVWDASAIAGIETEEQKELSAGYHYRADMTPGEFNGEPYDGVMRDIRGNHISLVVDGRAGPDVYALDYQPEEINKMKLTPKQIAMRAALRTYLAPKLGMDAAISDVTRLVTTNGSTTALASAAVRIYTPKLAQDMDIDPAELVEILSASTEGMDDAAVAPDPATAPGANDDLISQVMALLGDSVTPEVLEKVKAALGGGAPAQDIDAPPATPETPKVPGSVDAPAMDAAIKAVYQKATNDTIARMNAIRTAEDEVKPLIGAVVAMDSAESVYRLALEQSGVDITGVPASAYRSLVKMTATHRAEQATPRPALAMDSTAESAFDTMFPTAGKVTRM